MPPPSSQPPPSVDPVAARRWAAMRHQASPWLHEEVARRMAERLGVIRLPVRAWAHWEPVRGGVAGHDLAAGHYPGAQCFRVSAVEEQAEEAAGKEASGWWRKLVGDRPVARHVARPPDGAVQMVWANMLAHHSADPGALMAEWHRALAVNGFVMFSCLGPDTLKELRGVYARLGWPPPAHEFTDMHDWGDQLAAAGFAEPVMDMEIVTLTFPSPERLLRELRELGRNLHVERFGALRGRAWRQRLEEAIGQRLGEHSGQDDALALTFEVIYGHAVKPAPRHAVSSETAIGLDDMRAFLRQRNHDKPLP
ncbi:MAG: biotin synthase [Pseudomonadota bacterium]|nr:biotin synthase [Pseudomonadota bacterium]